MAKEEYQCSKKLSEKIEKDLADRRKILGKPGVPMDAILMVEDKLAIALKNETNNQFGVSHTRLKAVGKHL